MVATIGYWGGVRGMVNHIRLMLAHLDEKYEFVAWDGKNKEEWFSKKHTLGFPFPNLPYLIEGSTKLTQSSAITRYFARKHGLAAKTEEELQQEDVINGVLNDFRNAYLGLMYKSQDFEKDKVAYERDTVRPLLSQFEKWLTGKEYLVGNRLTFTDFIFFELVDINRMLLEASGLLKDFPAVANHHQKISNLHGVKEYLAQSAAAGIKINGATANWGGK